MHHSAVVHATCEFGFPVDERGQKAQSLTFLVHQGWFSFTGLWGGGRALPIFAFGEHFLKTLELTAAKP